VIARPSLLQYNTNKENDHIDDDDDDDTDGSTEPGGYSTVRDAIRLSSTPKNNTPTSKIPSISPIQKSQKQSVASGGRSLQQDDSNSTLASLSPYEEDNTRMVPVDDVRTPIYAQVKKVNKGNERVKKNVSISNLPMKEKHKHHTMNDDNQDEDEGGMLDESLMELEEINQPDTSLPTHRLPPSHVNSLPLLTTKNKQQPSTSPNDLSNLPFYNLNQSLQLPSGDQAYLLTRTGPDGRTQHYTATVISPTPMSPVPPPSQLATSYSPSSKLEHPMQSVSSRPGDIPISLIHQQPNIAYHNQPHSSQHKLEKRPVTKSTQTTPRQNNQPDEHAALKDSLMKMTAELSSHSLILEDDNNSDLMIEGISLDELIKELPQRLRKALSILNKSVADKQMQIQTYQMEVIKLKKKQDEIKHTNERLNETIRHQQESVLKEKQSFEKSLCEAKEEKEELRQKLAAQKSKYNQKKVEHKMEVTKLTSELYKLTCERDSIREQLSSMQQAHNKLQKFLKQQEPSGSVPLDDHKRSLREFEWSVDVHIIHLILLLVMLYD
jgi:hypothetical protein